MYIIAVIDPFDSSIVLYGPFDDRYDAEEWAEHIQGDWWVVDLTTPN